MRLAVVLLAACATKAPIPSVVFSPCVLSAPGQAPRLAAECATVTVPFTGERTIPLFVARVPASGGKNAADPILVIPGGPGQSASGSYIAIASAFAEAGGKRDVILVDPRGTGRSHPLDCKAHPRAELLAHDDPPLTLLADCAAAMTEDLRVFHTNAFVDDLEAVRAQLGVEQWNLYGVSYGSRVALQYVRRHRDRIRTIVLDGVVPPQTIVGAESEAHSARALALISKRCTFCKDGEIEQRITTLEKRLTTRPARVTFPHPRTGKPTTLTLSGKAVRELVRSSSYMAELVSPLPVLLRNADEREDYAALAASLQLQRDGMLSAVNPWVNLAVLCGEDAPKTGELAKTCPAFLPSTTATDLHQAVTSDVPALLLSGEADPVTPPENAELALKTLAKGRHVVMKGQGHNVVARGCIPHLLARFVETADALALDMACADAITGFPMFSEVAGP